MEVASLQLEGPGGPVPLPSNGATKRYCLGNIMDDVWMTYLDDA